MRSKLPAGWDGFLPTPVGVVAAHAWLPADRQVRGVAIVHPPWFEERKASALAVTRLATALAAEGLATVRFDPHGTGDSPGALAEAAVARWTADAAAVRAAVASAGVPVIGVGVRGGALLALETHARQPCDALVLWEPVTDGAEFLRQTVQRKLVNDMAAFGAAAGSRAAVDAAWSRGEAVDLDGYLVSSRLASDLRAFAPRHPEGVPILRVAARAARSASATASGARCTAIEEQRWVTPPFWLTVGLVDVTGPATAIAAWIAARADVRATRLRAWAPAGLRGASGALAVSWPGADGTERHGVWHAGAEAVPRAKVLLLSGWTGCRLGPHNVFVTLARRLAECGVASLRFDFTGRGDDPGDPAAASVAGMARDAGAALAWLRAQGGNAAPVTLVAICSGGKVALCVAADAPELAQLVLWSPEPMGSLRPSATNRRKTGAMLRTYFWKLLRPETWRKLLTGRVRTGMVRKALWRPETRCAAEAAAEDAVLARLEGFRGRVSAVFGGGDPEAAGAERAYTRFFERHGIPFERHWIPRAGHSFYRADWAEDLLRLTLAAVTRPPADGLTRQET